MATVFDLPPDLPLRRLRRSEFVQLAENGCFDDERVELLDGLIVRMSPPGPEHSHGVRMLDTLLRRVGDRAVVQAQLPLAFGEFSQPEPDLAVVPVGVYARHHPDAAFLVVEVSVSSLLHDRGRKGQIYARAGVPEYWILNVEDRVIEVYSSPGPDGYAVVRIVGEHEELAPAAFPDVRIAVREVLP